MENVNLAICNKCNGLFIDTNPQIGQKIFFVDVSALDELYDHRCPVCLSDDYLMDFEGEIEEQTSHTIVSIETVKYIPIN